jgi:hypothetical protein
MKSHATFGAQNLAAARRRRLVARALHEDLLSRRRPDNIGLTDRNPDPRAEPHT